MFNLNQISKYRLELMGCAVIMIILCHAQPYGVNLPGYIAKVFAFGNLGVEIFFLLSGLGMAYSLSSTSSNLFHWYKRRFIRILIPYLLISIPWYGIHAILFGENILQFISNVSTLSFWLYHKGAWFIAILLPLYMVTPTLTRCLYNNNGYITLSLLVISCALCSLITTEFPAVNNILFAVHRLPCYFIGIFLAQYVRQKIAIPYWTIFCCSIICIISLRIIDKDIGYWWPLVFILIPLVCLLIEQIPILSIWFKTVGSISLESYILNIALGDMLPQLFNDSNGYLRYSIIIVTGILTAIYVNKYLSVPLINQFK